MTYSRPKHTLILLLLVISASWLTTAVRLRAQSSSPQESDSENTGSEVETFSFPGGTLKEFVREAIKLSDEQQILLAPEIEDVEIAPVQITSAEPVALLGYLRAVANGRFEVGNIAGWETLAHLSPPPSVRLVVSLRGYATGTDEGAQEKIKSALETIEAALEVSSLTEPQIRLKFHPGTGLLLVSGTSQQVALISDIANQLILETAHQSAEGTQPLNKCRSLQQRIAELENELGRLRRMQAAQPTAPRPDADTDQ